MSITKIGALAVLALLGSGTICEAERRGWTRQDSWYRLPPEPWGRGAATLNSHRVTAVPKEKLPVAEAMLRHTSTKLLSAAEASGLLGVTLVPDSGMNFYLLRAVYLNQFNGAYEVRQSGTELEVHHGSLGRHALPMRRGAVIVQLTSAPTKLYVTCSMAE